MQADGVKKQVIAIHGGNVFETNAEFWKWFLSADIRFPLFKKRRWKQELQNDLGDGYEVLLPRLPHPHNAKYVEWKERFEKLIPYMHDEVILVGHSLGGIFLAKYLAEEKFPKNIRAVFLVAAVYDTDEGRKIPQFTLPDSLKLFEEQTKDIFLYHSTDDPVVAFSELAKFEKALPKAHVKVFEDKGHFNQAHFPELVADIRSLG